MGDEVFDSAEAIGEFKELMSDPAARQAFIQVKADKADAGARTRYEHILRAVGETPWAIRPAMLGVIVDILAFRAEGGRLSAEEVAMRAASGRRETHSGPKGVAVLALHGVIVPKAGLMSEVSGATSMEGFRSQFRSAMANPEVSALVMDVDSPGGMVDQVPEMAAEIRGARGSKPIVAVANSEAASAAYWLGSQADRFIATKSARVGSIGVFTAHKDESVKDEQSGVKTTLVSAGKFKTEGNPFQPLSEDARAHMQGLVNDYYGMFVGDVAKGRGVNVDAVRSGFGEGRVVGAADAARLGMTDGIGTLEGVVGSLLRQMTPAAGAFGQGNTITGNGGSFTLPAESATAWLPLDLESLGDEPQDDPEWLAAAVDESAWDGNKAMGQCSTAAQYRSICAGEHNAGQPDERQHWALPHHYLGKGPNAAGVRAALSRFTQTQDLKNGTAAKAHLDAHMSQITPGATDETPAPWSDDESLLELQARLSALSG